MSAGTCAGHGAEIEDDLIRLGRRSLEFEHDVRAALIGGRPRSRRLKALRPAEDTRHRSGRWRWQRSCPSAAMTSADQPATLGTPMAPGEPERRAGPMAPVLGHIRLAPAAHDRPRSSGLA